MSSWDSSAGIPLEAVQAALKEVQATWQAAANHLTELSSEQRKLYLGFTPTADMTLESLVASAKQIAAAEVKAATYPPSFDWRNHGGQNFVTPIRDQGACGSCVAFGTTAAVESAVRIQRNDANAPVDLSEASLFYCIGGAEGRNCSNGWWPANALIGYQIVGVPDEACFPYSPGDQPCTQCADWNTRVTKITGFHPLSALVDIKAWVSSHGPTSACMTVYDDFFSYASGVYHHVAGNIVGGHCVCIVGYDDPTGCWICKNSWGTGWGESGFFQIAYGECGIEGQVHAVDGILSSPTPRGCLPAFLRFAGRPA